MDNEYLTTPTQRVEESEREPGEDMYYYVYPNGEICCKWCGGSFCRSIGGLLFPEKGQYVTWETGEETELPIEPEGAHNYSYHPDCAKHKQTEIHAAQNASLWSFTEVTG